MNTLFLGGGAMTQAIIGGLMQQGYAPKNFIIVDHNQHKCDFFKDTYGMAAYTDYHKHIEQIDMLFLAIKPQNAKITCLALKPYLMHQPLIVSIMAGISTDILTTWLGQNNIIRAMPNTSSLVQAGMTGLYATPSIADSAKSTIESMLATIGATCWVDDETQMDVITALSGSGPAYFFYLLSCMQKTGVAMGLSASQAKTLVLQTMYGSAKLALSSNLSLASLQAQVTSKGGTTEAALEVFTASDFEAIIHKALQAAKEKGRRLNEKYC